jgi:hypothetical protein
VQKSIVAFAKGVKQFWRFFCHSLPVKGFAQPTSVISGEGNWQGEGKQGRWLALHPLAWWKDTSLATYGLA